MKKKTNDFKKLVLGSAGKKRVKEGNWSLFGIGKKKNSKPRHWWRWECNNTSRCGVKKTYSSKAPICSVCGKKMKLFDSSKMNIWQHDVRER